MRSALAALLLLAPPLAAQVRIGDLTAHEGASPVRLVGFGLVLGLDGSGDRSFGGSSGSVQTVRAVVNLLKRFNIEVPAERLRLRNVAAVMVTAEVSPYLRPNGRFDLQVASLGDATSLRGGVLFMTPLVADQEQAAVATGQGPLSISGETSGRMLSAKGAASGRIVEGGILEVALPTVVRSSTPRLVLRNPDLGVAARIQALIDSVYGAGTARVEDPGSILLKPPATTTDSLIFMAAIDTLAVQVPASAQIVIDGRTGMVVVGGDVPIRAASVSTKGITLRIGTAPGAADTTRAPGLVSMPAGTRVSDVAAGLHAAGVSAADIAALFEGLRASNAITARVTVR